MSFTGDDRRCPVAPLGVLLVIGISFIIAGGVVTFSNPAKAAGVLPIYDVALGDSLASGVGASSPAQSYVGLVYQHQTPNFPGLQLRNLSCPGATTTSMILGPNCGSSTPQLTDAETFLSTHQGQIAFVTIDIGANDVDRCATASSIDLACFTTGIQGVAANLPTILSGLEAADPGVKVFGMNYYDPFLALWLAGSSGQQFAQESVSYLDTLNLTLATGYAGAGIPVADAAAGFDSHNFALTGDYSGQTLPQNVSNVCNWTHMCTSFDIHANDAGHSVLADAFAMKMRFTPTMSTTTTMGTPTTTRITSTTDSFPTTTFTTVAVVTAGNTGRGSSGLASRSSGELAFTGPGEFLKWTALVGALLLLLGATVLVIAGALHRARHPQ